MSSIFLLIFRIFGFYNQFYNQFFVEYYLYQVEKVILLDNQQDFLPTGLLRKNLQQSLQTLPGIEMHRN